MYSRMRSQSIRSPHPTTANRSPRVLRLSLAIHAPYLLYTPHAHTRTQMYIKTKTLSRVSVCVCVCVCARA
jgi:hypothetical protein